ncbi:MAG TPA: DUF1549 and DUF1553 domain-containing protein, partial [Planctomycetota bacterium]|nr:DUF1549 and DUF1553 domain-containing protein [Planctomycetota bacterium]
LPASIADVDAFLADERPDAYERAVDRLLASPRYGERWGRHWLDAARYADTNGYEKDVPRSIWPYRDWVIDAFNRDLPFDRFTIEQVAGDLLPDATLETRVATGFFRNSMLNEEGGVDPEQFRVEAIVDRVDALGKAFLGLTLACGQCHNHKYDPISQVEYYRVFAFLNNDDEPEIEVPSREQIQKREEILAGIRRIEDELLSAEPDLPERMTTWEEESREAAGDWTFLEMDDVFGAIGVKFEQLDDQSLLALAHNPGESVYTIKVKTRLRGITAFRLEALTDANLPRMGPGRAPNGNFVIQELTIEAAPIEKPSELVKVALQNATADFSQQGLEVAKAIDGDAKTGWGVDAGPGRNQDRKAVFETKDAAGFEGGTLLVFNLLQKHGGAHTLGRFRLSATAAGRPVRADPVPSAVRRILATPAAGRTGEERRAVFSHYRTTQARFAEPNRKIDELMKEWPVGPTTLGLEERKRHQRTTTLFKRGDFKNPGAPVTPGVPAVLHPMAADERPNRLTLARWLASVENPLTPRVIVNRVWQSYFGLGIVPTSEDFGTRAEPPSHPELLDWLATELPRQSWSLKAIHRLIVTSATYRQSSSAALESLERDPYNRLLARSARLRLESEAVRDVVLEASGLLSRKIGGQSVYPPIPDGVLNLGYGAPMPWPTSTGEDRYRRGLYTFWKRTVPYPGLLIFDSPNADFSCVRRLRSNTPLQALTTLNDAAFHEAAQAMALRVWREGGTEDRSRAIHAFRLATGRIPKEAELAPVLDLVKGEESYFENRTAAAVKVASPDPASPPPDVNLHKVAAWTLTCRVILNLDETITRE